MAAPDPLSEAEVLLAYGRSAQAVQVLREAARAQPERVDIRNRRVELQSQERRAPEKKAAVAFHLFIAWLLFLAPFSVLFGVPILLVQRFGGQSQLTQPEGPQLFLLFLVAVALVVAASFVAPCFSLALVLLSAAASQ